MSEAETIRRGDPLVLLGLILIGWVAMRLVLWQSPFDSRLAPRALAAGSDLSGSDRGDRSGIVRRGDADNVASSPGPVGPSLDRPLPGLLPAPVTNSMSRSERRPAPGSGFVGNSISQAPRSTTVRDTFADNGGSRGRSRGRSDAGQAALAPDAAIASAAREPGVLARGEALAARLRRWTGDAWLLLRNGSAAPLLPGQPSYGRSQAGAALRYRLAPSSRRAPQAFVRASGAIESPRDVELAGGLSARPLPDLPVRVAAELRIADTGGGTDLRPAAYANTEFPPVDLPLGARGEVFAQGGYVGGDFATAFVDGQARVVRDVAALGDVRISAGAGAWGGAQKGASRIDVGPGALVSFRLGQVNTRVALDYRVRVGGDAAPASGPALTLAAGF